MERTQKLWHNATETEHARHACAHELFESQAARTPDMAAVEFDGERLTYRELNERADKLKATLRMLGVGPNVRVVICAGRSFEMVVGVLAVLKAGGAYVPLDPRYPSDRLALMLEDSKAAVILTQRALANIFSPKAAHTICLDEFNWSTPEIAPPDTTDSAPGPESLAYVIYTSGSTGRPKGVAMVHRALVNLMEWQRQQSSGLSPAARTLQFTSLSFDVSFQEIFGTWCHGGTLVLMSEALRYDAAGLWRYLREERIQRLFMPFVALQQLAEAAGDSDDVPTALREVITAGEQLQITPNIREMFCRLPEARLHNHYGPSETHVVTAYSLPPDPGSWTRLPPIGKPIANTQIHLLDGQGKRVPAGEAGELFIGGDCLARGYLGQPKLTEERFVADPFRNEPGARLYRTGDLARHLSDGNIEFLGRIDDQVKIRGHRIELGEIEVVLAQHPGVRGCAVITRGEGADKQLAAYVVAAQEHPPSSEDLRAFLKSKLAEYMVPARFVTMDSLPLTPSGKVNRRALPQPDSLRSQPEVNFTAPGNAIEQAIAQVWREALRLPEVGTQDNFFDLGGNSLMLARVQRGLSRALHRDVSIVSLFRYPTITALAKHLSETTTQENAAVKTGSPASRKRRAGVRRPEGEVVSGTDGIAIIGMAGRFPGAKDIPEFWQNLCAGRECLTAFTDEELLATGVNPEVLKDPGYVRTRGILAGVEMFDASFFGFTRKDAEVTDPQQRIFLECAWHAFEDGGYDPATFTGSTGVYAGSSMNTFFLKEILGNRSKIEHFARAFQVDGYNLLVGNDKDYLATRVAYKLNLRGPAVTVQTACSTSLVAVCQACAGLLSKQCDLALAGGVSISFPQQRGYIHEEGAIASGDGHCRAFDAEASGTVFGAGAAAVLLKRLADAVADGDHIYAVIKGAALNNDGADKVSFSAPSVNGQAEVVALAHEQAGVTADTIGFVEAHGTGTPLGDPIEVAALTQAFRATTDKKQFCALGSAKTNVGHLEAAAGVTGLIKAALALKHRVIPPTLHFRTPNPKCEFETSPFYVAADLIAWPQGTAPRRAGVSSFGVGGTNAHVVLEEAPATSAHMTSRPAQLLTLSARTDSALEKLTETLVAYLEQTSRVGIQQLSGVAFTLQNGRRAFPCRRAIIARDMADAIARLKSKGGKAVFTGKAGRREPAVVFLFPGQGAQYSGMGRELYQTEPVFREHMDRCLELLQSRSNVELRSVLYPPVGEEARMSERLCETSLAQPALFAIEYSLAKLWMSWGIQPAAMAGHSIGEFVAAVLAGVMSLEDGLALVAERGRLMQSMPAGRMLAVRLPEAEVQPLLTGALSVAVINSPQLCVVAGPPDEITALQAVLEKRGVGSKPLRTSHAFHSTMMEPIVESFTDRVCQIKLNGASIPIVSTLSGRWIQANDWANPEYWGRQLRSTVRFADAVATLATEPSFALLEVGPGQTLTTLVQQHPTHPKEQLVLPSMPPVQKPEETASVLGALGGLWSAGVKVDWEGFWRHEPRQRVALPGYPFERERHWPESPVEGVDPGLAATRQDSRPMTDEEIIFQQLTAMLAQLDALASRPMEKGLHSCHR